MKPSLLCNDCPESPFCETTCPEALVIIPSDPKDRMKDSKRTYVAKGVPLLSYTDSRLTKSKNTDIEELRF